MIKTILGTVLIIFAIVFIYPKEIIVESIIGEMIFMRNSEFDKKIVKIGDVEIDNYEKEEFFGKDGYDSECKAYYFNNEQAKEIEKQIKNDENWTDRAFSENVFSRYKKFNVNNLGKSYYYLEEYDRERFVIETKRNILDNKEIKWLYSAIYDSDNKVLYIYYIFYEK